MYPKGRQNYENTIQSAAKRYGIDPEMLAGVLGTESDFDPAAVNPKSGATGIAQLMPKYFPGAGRNPHEDIDTAAAYLRTLRDSFQKSGESEDDAYYHAFQSYNAGQSRVRKAMAGKGPPLKQETLDYPGKVLSYAAGAVPTPGAQNTSNSSSNSKTEVNIGKVDVVTRATDTEGIARDFAGAAKRKLMAAQADVGMQ
jgi:soluble lytic murein transglycosylase-like protein